MKHIRLFSIAVALVALFTACGDDKKEESPLNPVNTEGTTYNQSITLDASGTQQTVKLTNLTSKIDEVENSNTWLTVLISPYTSGTPSIVVSSDEHTGTTARSGSVTIVAVNGDKVILSVTQKGKEEQKTGIDDPHDVSTDQPAYSRQRP